MIGQFIVELCSAIVGDAVMGALFQGWSRPEPSPGEGQWNASLGTVAAFLSALAARFAGLSSYGMMVFGYDGVLGRILFGSLIMAVVAGRLARRTFEVTMRRHALAHVGLWLSRATVILAVVTLATMGFTSRTR